MYQAYNYCNRMTVKVSIQKSRRKSSYSQAYHIIFEVKYGIIVNRRGVSTFLSLLVVGELSDRPSQRSGARP